MLSYSLFSKTELFAQKNTVRKLQEMVSINLWKWIASAEKSAKNNQPYNHQVLYTIKNELNKLFEEEFEKLQ